MGVERRLLEPVADVVVGALERRAQDVVLGAEVVGEGAGGVPRLGGDLADRGVLEPDAVDHPPRRLHELLPPCLVVDELGTRTPSLRPPRTD